MSSLPALRGRHDPKGWTRVLLPACRAAAAAGTALHRALLRGFYGWGATPEEQHEPLPGDEVITHPRLAGTMAISIAVPPAAVWPRLVSMGQDRAGRNSSLFIENRVLRPDSVNADRIHPE